MTLYSQIVQCANNSQRRTLIQDVSEEIVYNELDQLKSLCKINNYLKHIFSACDQDLNWSTSIKTKLVIKTLKILRQTEHNGDAESYSQIINKLLDSIRITNMKPEHLIKMCNILLQNIESGNDKIKSWGELIPVILQKISLIDKIEYQDDLIEAGDYNHKVIKTLLDMTWKQDNVVPLAEMFLSLQLNSTEINQIIQKFIDCLKWLNADLIPPLVFHLLKLSSSSTTSNYILLIKLQHHFGSIIYDSKSYIGSIYSESLNHDLESTLDKQIESESNVFYHISRAVYRKSVQKYLEYLKNSTKLYETILHPFNFKVLLIIAADQQIPELLDLIKSAMMRYFVEEEMRERNFFNEQIKKQCDLGIILKQIIDNRKSKTSDNITNGLLQLTVVLLTSSAQIGRENIVAQLCRVATSIIIRIVDVSDGTSGDMIEKVLSGLKEAMRMGRNGAFVMECFATVAMKFKFKCLNNSYLMSILNNFFYMPNYEANVLIEVVMQLSRYKSSIKENVMVMLQTSLQEANKLETHMNFVTAYLKILKYLKISSAASLSQTDSELSISTQISMSRTSNSSQACIFSNEAICKEVIYGLQHVFYFQYEAVLHLYKGLPDVVDNNLELVTGIWSFLWDAFTELRQPDLPPINFERVWKIEGDEFIPTGSISHMVLTLAMLLVKLPDTEIDDYQLSFNEIAKQMNNCDVEHFIVDKDVALNDGSCNAHAQIYILHEAINSYDAFISYYILSWTSTSENNELNVKQLFKAQKRLIDYLRTYQKGKKKDSTLASTTLSASSTRGNLNQGNKKIKIPNSILPLQVLDKMINLLYSDSVSWTTPEKSNTLKVIVSFHHHILEAVINTAQATKQIKNFTFEKSKYYELFTSIENNLYNNCVKKFDALLEFDSTTAALALEAFYHVLIVKHHIVQQPLLDASKSSHQNETWMNLFEPQETKTEDNQLLQDYIHTFQELFNQIEVTDDNDSNKVNIAMVNNIALLIGRIPLEDKQYAHKVKEWMKKSCREKVLPSKIAANCFVGCLINLTIRFTSSLSVVRLIVLALRASFGSIDDGAAEEGAEMAMVNSTSSPLILQTVLNTIKSHHDDISWIIRRIKFEYDYFVLLESDATSADHLVVQRKERNACSKLVEITGLLTTINTLSVQKQSGSLSEKILQCNIYIFKLLTTIAAYFCATATANNVAFQNAKFDGLIRYTVKKLIPAVYEHIESTKDAEKDSKHVQHLKSIPNVILGIESLKKTVMQLSIKTKIEVYDFMGVGQVRGFKVKGLEKMVVDDDEMDDTSVSSPAASSTQNGDSSESEKEVPVKRKRQKK